MPVGSASRPTGGRHVAERDIHRVLQRFPNLGRNGVVGLGMGDHQLIREHAGTTDEVGLAQPIGHQPSIRS